MIDVIRYGLLGLGLGAIYVMLGQGMLLIYRGSGVINIAQGAFAMFGAYTYLQLHAPESLDPTIEPGHGLPIWLSIILAVVITAVIGLIVDRLILQKMKKASPLTRLIATVIVLLLLQAIASKIWGSTAPFVEPIFPNKLIDLGGGISVPETYIWLLAVAIVLTVVLTIIWRYTRVGWVTAAVAQNERGAAALGISPNFVSTMTWMVGTGLAALAGIFVTPITQVSVSGLSLLIVPVLAALVFAGFKNYFAVLGAGMFIGVVQTILIRYNHDVQEATGIAAIANAFPVLVLIIVLWARGSALPVRGQAGERLPDLGNGRFRWGIVIPLVVILLALIFTVFSTNNVVLGALTVTFALTILLLSLIVVIGYNGQVSLAQYAIAGTGGLIAAQLTVHLGAPFLVSLIVGAVAASAVGVLFALPALRTRGVNLAVITLAAAWAVYDMVFTNDKFVGGSGGMPVGIPSIFGFEIGGSAHPERYAAFSLIIMVLAMLLVTNVRKGRMGRSMIAVRSNERAAAASGVNVQQTKIMAFAISGALAGLGGILLTYQYELAVFTYYDSFNSLLAVAWIIIGGVGFVVGAIFAAVGAPGALSSLIGLNWDGFVSWLPLIAGVGSLGAVIFNPHGIVQDLAMRFGKLDKKISANLPWVKPVKQYSLPTDAIEVTRVEPKTLTIDHLSVRYGGVVAVNDLSFEVKPGQVIGLIGPNGAGKTSLMDAVTGFTPYSGKVLIDGKSVNGKQAHQRADRGLVRSFQGVELFPEMTVLENLQVPQDHQGGFGGLVELIKPAKTKLHPVTIAAVRDFGLEDLLNRTPDDISFGQRRLVAIARAVAARPSILLLDEPVAGLSEHESEEFGQLVRRLADNWGMAILVIEHDMNFVMTICDEINVIDFGTYVTSGTPQEVRESPAAIAAYLGDDTEEQGADADEAAANESKGVKN